MDELNKICLAFVLIMLLLTILVFFSVIKHKEVCNKYDLKLSWGDLNCYKDSSEGIIKYRVEETGFFRYRLNSVPIVPER